MPIAMVHSIHFDDAGYVHSCRYLKGKTIRFKRGLNILYGDNGSGKTTIIDSISRYSLCSKGGYPQMIKPILMSPFEKDAFEREVKGRLSFDVVADDICFNWGVNIGDGVNFGSRDSRIFSVEDEAVYALHDRSKGEMNTMLFEGAFGSLKNVPSGYDSTDPIANPLSGHYGMSSSNDRWTAALEESRKWVLERLTSDKPGIHGISILMDEPDDGLSFLNAYYLYYKILPQWAERGYQVIASTHNPIVLSKEFKGNVVPLGRKYYRESVSALEKIFPQSCK